MGKTKFDSVVVVLNTLSIKRPDVYQEQKSSLERILKHVEPGVYAHHKGWILYFFVNKKHREVDYVGITRNLSRRMSNHEKLNVDIHDIVIIKTKDEQATKELENCFIRDFQPRLNTIC